MAAMPSSIESWRKPPVLENTSTLVSSAASSTVTLPGIVSGCSEHTNV